jgi:hypothetical protein
VLLDAVLEQNLPPRVLRPLRWDVQLATAVNIKQQQVRASQELRAAIAQQDLRSTVRQQLVPHVLAASTKLQTVQKQPPRVLFARQDGNSLVKRTDVAVALPVFTKLQIM